MGSSIDLEGNPPRSPAALAFRALLICCAVLLCAAALAPPAAAQTPSPLANWQYSAGEVLAKLGEAPLPEWRITLGATFGVQIPATFTAPQLPPELVGNNPTQLGQSSTMVVRQEGDVSLLPAGEKAMPIFAIKLLARQDFLEYFSAIIDLYYTNDQNQSKLCRSFDGSSCAPADATARESEFIRTFIKPHALGFNVTLQAKF